MTWNFATSHIGHDGVGNLTLEVSHRCADLGNRFGGVFWLSTPPLPAGTPERDLFCPLCAADRGLTVSGVWGGPAQLTCVCGHSWTPRLPGLAPQEFLRKLVRLALSSDPGPGLPLWRMRDDHDAEPPSVLQDAVHPHVVEAGHALNRRDWEFTEYERSVASGLLSKAAGRTFWDAEPTTALAQEQPTDEDRLAWMHEDLRTLQEYSRLTSGRLGRFLSDCARALHPAAALTVDDLEPGGTPWSGLSTPVLDDARTALSNIHVVLTAGTTGDIDY